MVLSVLYSLVLFCCIECLGSVVVVVVAVLSVEFVLVIVGTWSEGAKERSTELE